MYPDWTRLKDYADALEARRNGLKSDSGTLPQESWPDSWPLDACCNQPFSVGGCYPLPTITMDALGRKA